MSKIMYSQTNKPCKDCKKYPQYYHFRCHDCFNIWNAKNERRKEQRRREKRAQLPVHTRVCVGCGQLFDSQKGFNLCYHCETRAWEKAKNQTLDKRAVKSKHLIIVQQATYGRKWKPKHIPAIPLSSVGVFDAIRRTR